MSLRYASRFVVQLGARAAQAARSVKESATAASNSGAGAAASSGGRGVRRVSTSVDSKHGAALAKAVADAKRKRAEESLRMVMFLSVWGPN